MALGSRLGEQVCRIVALGGSSAGEQVWGVALDSCPESFEAASGSSFEILGTFFGMWRSVPTLESSFGEQICNFAAILTNNCF